MIYQIYLNSLNSFGLPCLVTFKTDVIFMLKVLILVRVDISWNISIASESLVRSFFTSISYSRKNVKLNVINWYQTWRFVLKFYFICMEVTHENGKGNGRTAFKIPAFSRFLYCTCNKASLIFLAFLFWKQHMIWIISWTHSGTLQIWNTILAMECFTFS